jgi:hypothetical protein
MSVEIAYGEYGRIYYMKKEGNKWSDLIQISVDSLGNTWNHDMAVNNSGIVHFFFHASDIYYRTHYDSVLSEPINITNLDLNHYTAFSPRIAIDPENTIHLTYRVRDDDSDVKEIYYRKFDGILWTDPIVISDINDLSSFYQYMTLDSQNNLHVVWEQRLTKLDTVLGIPTIVSYREIFYTTNRDGSWSTPENISNIPKSSSYRPKIAIYKDQPLVFYQTFYENGSEQQRHYSYHLDDKWSVTPFNVNINTNQAFDYFISSSETLHIVTGSSPITQISYIEYIRGYNNPTFLEGLNSYNSESFNLKNYPNPFNNETKIQFYLDRTDNIELKILDVTGKLIKTILPNQRLNSGSHFYEWDATNNQRKEVSSGIYFLIILRNSELVNSRKIILFK